MSCIVPQLHSRHSPDRRSCQLSGSGPRFLLSNSSCPRLFLYNTCLVVCGVSMSLTNYFHPLLVTMAGEDCELGEAAVCDPYIGQLVYAVLYGITR